MTRRILDYRSFRLPRRPKYPVWSVETITAYALALMVVTAACVFLLGKRSFFHETELTLGIVAAALFVFLAVGLYHGVRVKRSDLPGVDVQTYSVGDLADALPDVGNGMDIASAVADAEGCASAIVGLVLGIFVGVVLILFLWVVINLGIVLWVFLLAALSWVFYLALRQVFAKSRVCRGDMGKSISYALLYTILYTGWLFVLALAADMVFGARLRHG